MPTYSVVSSNSSTRVYAEGDSITFYVTTTDIPNGTPLYWNNIGSLSSSDFTQNINKGRLIINNNTATLTLTFAEDYKVDTPRGYDKKYAPANWGSVNLESLILQFRAQSETGPVVVTEFTRYIVDTSKPKKLNPVDLPTVPITQIQTGQFPLNITTVTNSLNLPFWKQTGNLGLLDVGETSELYIESNTTQTFDLIYEKISGELPSGLSLLRDGSISGTVINAPSTATNYYFTASFSKNVGSPINTSTFYITAYKSTTTNYTPIWFDSFFNNEQRTIIDNLLRNQDIFKREEIYRPFDNNFGISQNIRWYLHYGVENITNINYFIPLIFSKRRFRLSEPKIAFGKNSIEETVYEVVYSEIIDYNQNELGESLPPIFQQSGVYYFPTSVINWRKSFETEGRQVTDKFNPRFMKSRQNETSTVLGYIPCVIYCYALPNKGTKIIDRIKKQNISFNQFDFTIDKYYKYNLVDRNLIDTVRFTYVQQST